MIAPTVTLYHDNSRIIRYVSMFKNILYMSPYRRQPWGMKNIFAPSPPIVPLCPLIKWDNSWHMGAFSNDLCQDSLTYLSPLFETWPPSPQCIDWTFVNHLDLLWGGLPFARGASINYVDKQGGGDVSLKCQRYYISLCSKLVNEGGGSKILKTLST